MLHRGRARQTVELLAQGQGKWLGDVADPSAATDVTSLSIPLVCSEAGYGLAFQQPEKAGDCSKKRGLKLALSSFCYPQHYGDDGRDELEVQRGHRPSRPHSAPQCCPLPLGGGISPAV